MTEDDLKTAQELFRRRKMVAESWEVARRGAEWGITADVHLNFRIKERDATGARFDTTKQLSLTKEDGAAMCKLAVTVLTERLKDIDASLRAFGCEPPREPAEATEKLRQ
jgi:hypothetical protein